MYRHGKLVLCVFGVVLFSICGKVFGGVATGPSPANGATDVAITADLSWTAGAGAVSHDVYFGTSQTAVDTAGRLAGDVNGSGSVDIDDIVILAQQWLDAPVEPYADLNDDSDVDVADFAVVSADWLGSAVSVYKGNQTATSYDPGTLAVGTTYYWRIDEVHGSITEKGTVWSFTTELPLVVSGINPATYTVRYDSLAVGQLVYIDRAYTFTNVATFGGATYIKTANDDKSSTVSSFLTFTINKASTICVAYDDGMNPKPSWLSSFTDTGENLTNSGSTSTFSVYSKDFSAGAVTLGGNAGDGSSSMYSVIIVDQGTIPPVVDYDLYSDTWVAVDALGRALPGYDECGPPREDRYVALFYFLWQGEHGTGGPYDITKLLAANPTDPAYGPGGIFPTGGAPHHWGESELGYYLSNDQWVMRKHAFMLANAGVDVIVFDITNAYTYEDNYKDLCSVFMDVRANGGTTPQIAFMAYAYADQAVQAIYNALYSQGLYSDLWFYWKGKPLVLAPLNGDVVNSRTITYNSTLLNFFNMRRSWAWTEGQDTWNWIDDYPQGYGWHESSSIPEETSVCAGHHPNSNKGRSYHDGSQPSYNQYKLSGYEHLGLNLDEQFDRLDQIDPELVFITGWNEWFAGRYIVPDGQQFPFLGNMIGPGGTFFVDAYNQEYSRDIEPMKGGHTDNYYYQMIDGIRRYKGVRQPQTPSAATTITIDGSFADWDYVTPGYRDWLGDTMHRNTTGWGSAGTYTNTTGRNDFTVAKVARDATYIYFYMETDVAITSYTGSNWMMLFINADQNYSDGWQGYDYVVNMGVTSSTVTTLKGTSGGWNWTNVNTNISYRVSGNKMEIRVPRSDIGQGSGDDEIAFDFHWSDNIQATNDIIQFAISGDSAPDRRFNYRYEVTGTATEPVVVNPSFEIPNVSGYVYGPTGSSWSYTGGGYVIADSGSAWSNTAYAGSQNMVMQGVVSVYQAVSGFQVGHDYTVSWAEADRPGSLGGNTLRVLLDSTVVEALHTVTNDSWVVQTSNTFTATAATHTLKFDATNTQGGDRSVFIDQVTISEVE